MKPLRKLLRRLRTVHPWVARAARLGTYLMLLYLIVGLSCRLAAPYHMDSYFRLMALYRGCMEAAPASLVAGLGAALLGHLMLSRGDRTADKRDDDD